MTILDMNPAPIPAHLDYMQQPDRWVGPNIDVRARKSLSNECLAALRQAAADKGRQLTDAERGVIIQKFS